MPMVAWSPSTRTHSSVLLYLRFAGCLRFAINRCLPSAYKIGCVYAHEQMNPVIRRGRFIAPIADLSAPDGFPDIQMKQLKSHNLALIFVVYKMAALRSAPPCVFLLCQCRLV